MFTIPPAIEQILETFCQNGHEAYLVGGCVRDLLCRKQPHDYDITTSADPQTVLALFPKTIQTGVKHGTVTVLSGGYAVEVTTYRTDGEYRDSRRPETVTFVKSLREDLARRDFTVNAIAYHPKTGLQDPFNGRKDIQNRLLRAVGDPRRRFTEDALRILRLFRFSSQLGFVIEPDTLQAALACADALPHISAERIKSELCRTLNGANPAALAPLTAAGKLTFLGINSPNYPAITSLQGDTALFAFLWSGGADMATALESLKASNREKTFCRQMIALFTLPFPADKPAIKNRLAATSPSVFKEYLLCSNALFQTDIRSASAMFQEILDRQEPYLISHLAVDGQDLKSLGISGKKIGKTLEALRQTVVLDPAQNQRETLLAHARSGL